MAALFNRVTAMQIRLYPGMKCACRHGSTRHSAALTAMTERIAPAPRQWFAAPGCIRPQPAIDPAPGLASRPPSTQPLLECEVQLNIASEMG